MKKPKMILFDYGQTLISEGRFDGIKGTKALLKYAVKNKYNKTAEEIQEAANAINRELGRGDRATRHLFQVEAPNSMFTSYLYTSLGVTLSIGPEEIDRIFWNAASPGTPTEGIADFLQFLQENGIRTGVISNISYCSQVVKERINNCIPNHNFEFIIATSAYLFRKPNKRIFDMAMEMADLSPEDVWFIGDDYQCDVVGASKAGCFPVWYIGAIDTGYVEKDGVLTVRTWEELQEIIGRL